MSAVGSSDRFTVKSAGITDRPYAMTIPTIFTWNGDVRQPTYQDTGDPMFIEHTREAGIYGALRLNPIDGVKLIAGGRYTDWKTATDDYDITSLLTAPPTWRKEKRFKIGRAHVCTPVTHAHLVCRLLLEKKQPTTTYTRH